MSETIKGFKRTTAINKIARMTKRKRVIQGGSSAGKTIAIISILINKAIKNPMMEITVVGASIPHLKQGAMKEFLKLMKILKRYDVNCWHDTNRKYTFPNGAYIEFINADEDKAIGPRRDVLYCNEANLITFQTYTQLAARTSGTIYLDFNPVNEFWAHKEVLGQSDSELLVLNYLDNQALPDNVLDDFAIARKKAETSEYWANWCKVYIDGLPGSLEGVIFTNWTEIDSVPKDARLIGYGQDFGFTNDPTTLVAVYMYEGKLVLNELFYQKGLLNSANASLIKQFGAKNGPIYADSSNPNSIADVKGYGIAIFPVKKGPDSIKDGIQVMQEYEFLVTKSSKHLKEELEKYEWMKKGDTNTPIDAWCHCIDAARYLIWMKLGSRASTNSGPDVFTMEY